MTTRFLSQASMLLAIALLPMTATATAPTLKAEGDFEGRHYQVYAAKGISWTTAEAAAGAATYGGVSGHLVTITSEAEDAFVDMLRSQAYLDRPEAWAGGFQQSGSTEPGDGWMWINNEGPISTPQAPLPSYSNWQSGEPNDQHAEKYLGVGHGGNFGWNDEQALGNIGGYIVEFDTATAIDPGECQEENGCETTVGQIIEYPPDSVQEDAEVGVKTYEFTDDMSRCGQTPLTLFAADGIPDNEIVIPPYLCGSPKFLVVQVETEGVDIFDGTVLVENEVLEALPLNLYECTGPVDQGQSIANLQDPQHRDRVTYQTTDPSKMIENDIGHVVDSVYAGSLGEVTFECGSSRGKIKSASYYVIGMSINFGTGYDLETNPDANFDAFAALTRYKLVVLQGAVQESRPALNGTLAQKRGFNGLNRLVGMAISLHDRGRYDLALQLIRLFQQTAEGLSYDAIPDENYSGEHQMRASNIEFMYTDSILPFMQ